MTFNEAFNIVQKVQYKSNTYISLHKVTPLISELTIIYNTSCLDTGKGFSLRSIQVLPEEVLSRFTEKDLLKSIRAQLIDLELHEVDEWYKYKETHVRVPDHSRNIKR